jgi:hypothetical protein
VCLAACAPGPCVLPDAALLRRTLEREPRSHPSHRRFRVAAPIRAASGRMQCASRHARPALASSRTQLCCDAPSNGNREAGRHTVDFESPHPSALHPERWSVPRGMRARPLRPPGRSSVVMRPQTGTAKLPGTPSISSSRTYQRCIRKDALCLAACAVWLLRRRGRREFSVRAFGWRTWPVFRGQREGGMAACG